MGNVAEGIKTYPVIPGPDESCGVCGYAEICRGGCPRALKKASSLKLPL